MNNALKQNSVNENELLHQAAVVIPIGEATLKHSHKKTVKQVKETNKKAPAALFPGFTSPVFKPRKHDLL
ncbi:MAG: hypothetical protein JST09_02770 [Bacteroidetes bacterium]|nr:hypothetical protein [Bacteroidota bacterium]